MTTEKSKALENIRANRMVYDPPIREAIALNDLDHMKAVLKEAQSVHDEQAAAIDRLKAAIHRLS